MRIPTEDKEGERENQDNFVHSVTHSRAQCHVRTQVELTSLLSSSLTFSPLTFIFMYENSRRFHSRWILIEVLFIYLFYNILSFMYLFIYFSILQYLKKLINTLLLLFSGIFR